MNNTRLYIHGSSIFFDILKELEIFNYVKYFKNLSEMSKELEQKTNDSIVRIIFTDLSQKIFFKDNLPTIFVSNDNNYFIENKSKFSNFDLGLSYPIDIFSFAEIIKILSTKHNFFKKSEIFIKGYLIDSNQKLISKMGQKTKITEKELKLILALKEGGRYNKKDLLKKVWNYNDNLESHAFETHLHRLRKKMERIFNDKKFINEEKSFYFF